MTVRGTVQTDPLPSWGTRRPRHGSKLSVVAGEIVIGGSSTRLSIPQTDGTPRRQAKPDLPDCLADQRRHGAPGPLRDFTQGREIVVLQMDLHIRHWVMLAQPQTLIQAVNRPVVRPATTTPADRASGGG